MPQPDPIQGFGGLPEWTEPYKIPETLKALYDFLVNRGIPRFPTRAAADTAIPGAVAGQVIWSDADSALYIRRSNAWRIVWPTPTPGGPRSPSWAPPPTRRTPDSPERASTASSEQWPRCASTSPAPSPGTPR